MQHGEFFLYNYYCFVADESDLEAKYRRSTLDVAILQDHIGEQQLLYLMYKLYV